MTEAEFKTALVRMTATRFHRFISKTNARMEDLIQNMETGPIDKTCPLEKVAVECMQEFVQDGHAKVMRELGEKAENLAERAGVEYLSEHDARVLAGELADMLSAYDDERQRLRHFYDKMQATAKQRVELN